LAIDLDSARATFESSVDFTVGIEEEFALLDPGTLDLAQRYEVLRAAAGADPLLAQSVAGELIASEIEIRSGRAQTLPAAFIAQRERRRALFALAPSLDIALGASGTHPWADYREQRIIDTEHYRRVEQGLRYVAWRNNTFSLHVHVGVRGIDRAVQVCDRLREVLPALLAISSNSPFLEGRDSGLHSARSQIFTRSFPRCGIPDAFGSSEAYLRYVEFLVLTGSIIEYTQVWWSIRPHFTFGTVEVRICDAQPTAGESEALAALIVACVAQAARDLDEGVPHVPQPPRMIEENVWRAIRYGLDGRMIDLGTGETFPTAAAADRLLAWTAPVRSELGIEVSLPPANGSQRQRALLTSGLSLQEVYAQHVAQAAETYTMSSPNTVEAR